MAHTSPITSAVGAQWRLYGAQRAAYMLTLLEGTLAFLPALAAGWTNRIASRKRAVQRATIHCSNARSKKPWPHFIAGRTGKVLLTKMRRPRCDRTFAWQVAQLASGIGRGMVTTVGQIGASH